MNARGLPSGIKWQGLAIGYKMATAAMERLESLRAEDEELVAIVENDACGVDALQCASGCTFGKGNLLFRDYGKQAYTIYHRSTRSGVRVHFHGKGIPEDLQEDRSALISWILSASNDSIISVTPISIPEPEPARIRKSIPCEFCGESHVTISKRSSDRTLYRKQIYGSAKLNFNSPCF
jgi:formylmethanofuran dehydrogenase subunit E